LISRGQAVRRRPRKQSPKATIYVRLPRAPKESIEASAKYEGVSLNA
jgi:hypothetical protein